MVSHLKIILDPVVIDILLNSDSFYYFAMRKIILIYLFFSFSIAAYNQIITGIIRDQSTGDIIPMASAYFSGTFVGTSSGQDGSFRLDISKNGSMPLTISAIGYNTITLDLTGSSEEKPLLINLVPKVFELKEVIIDGKSNARERKSNLILFRKAFLGTTPYAKKCEIINENDITFVYDAETDTLKAFSVKPIIISNMALGYNLTFFLDAFALHKKNSTFYFKGSILFNENLAVSKTKERLYNSRRKEAYLGSRMHFFRALWENKLESATFTIQDINDNLLKYDDIVFPKDSLTKSLKCPKDLKICYCAQTNLGIIFYPSLIIFNGKEVLFEKNGYIDPVGIGWAGMMGKQRIADWLPYEYQMIK
jgi:hypothetical protein